MSDTKNPKKETKKPVSSPFSRGSRFSGSANTNVGKSQYKPMPIRITQHKG